LSVECLIVADDLTGACDAAVPFASRGLGTVAWLDDAVPVPAEAAVVALSTESRNLGAEAARESIQKLAQRWPATGAHILFKKIDSMLRGSPGAEIAAALEAFGCETAVVTPAFPAMGRIVESGRLWIAGSDAGPIDVAACLRGQGLEPARFRVVDAATDSDLDRAVAELLRPERRILWSGSAGLAAALARAVGRESGAARRTTRGPVLFAVGSEHPVTMEQQRRLLAMRPSRLVAADSAVFECCRAGFDEGAHVLLRVDRLRISDAQLREVMEAARGRIAATVLSGGDTAALVCRALGVHGIELADEVAAGIPRGIYRGGVLDGAEVVTKSGAFGGPDALIEIADTLNCSNL
jgi:uncharacterized protein YgbK (DUF1537 family)